MWAWRPVEAGQGRATQGRSGQGRVRHGSGADAPAGSTAVSTAASLARPADVPRRRVGWARRHVEAGQGSAWHGRARGAMAWQGKAGRLCVRLPQQLRVKQLV